MNAEVSKGKDTVSEEKTVEKSQQSPESNIESVVCVAGNEHLKIPEVNLTELQERVVKLEGFMNKLLKRIDLKDNPVKIPPKKNYNPDYLPTGGGEPVTIKELPPKKGN